jgi:hypothetical protein
MMSTTMKITKHKDKDKDKDKESREDEKKEFRVILYNNNP